MQARAGTLRVSMHITNPLRFPPLKHSRCRCGISSEPSERRMNPDDSCALLTHFGVRNLQPKSPLGVTRRCNRGSRRKRWGMPSHSARTLQRTLEGTTPPRLCQIVPDELLCVTFCLTWHIKSYAHPGNRIHVNTCI